MSKPEHTIHIRPAFPDDRPVWERLREALWPVEAGGHAKDIDRYFSGARHDPLEVLIAFDESGEAVGVIELSIRAYAEGCETDRVAFIEGWYVTPAMRGKGVGAVLVHTAEAWGRAQGCVELGSDTEVDNVASAAAHLALGFQETGVVRCFKKRI